MLSNYERRTVGRDSKGEQVGTILRSDMNYIELSLILEPHDMEEKRPEYDILSDI
jgi:hypothetical protein